MAQTQSGHATPQPTVTSTSDIGRSGNQGQADRTGPAGSGQSTAEQARRMAQEATSRASDMWDDLSDRGARYYHQGSRAVGDLDGASVAALLTAGAIGLALGWLVFGQRSYSGDSIARRMSQSSDRYR